MIDIHPIEVDWNSITNKPNLVETSLTINTTSPLAGGGNLSTNRTLSISATPTFTSITLSGGQIAFPTGAVPSGDPNTMDDYEEGTWTPTVTFGGGNTGVVYNAGATVGKYTKIGNLINVSGSLRLTNNGSDTGTVQILGLPFSPSNVPRLVFVVGNTAGVTVTKYLWGEGAGGVYFFLKDNLSYLTDVEFTDTAYITFHCTYQVI